MFTAMHSTSSVFVFIVFFGFTCARQILPDVKFARRNALAGDLKVDGWWHTLKTRGGRFCELRDFPPRGIYGTSRVYCPTSAYDHYWMWRIAKASGSGTISSGDEVHIINYQPISKYCKLSSGTLSCGAGYSSASKFVLEKVSGTGVVDLLKDEFRLRSGQNSSSGYCSLSGSGRSQQLKCEGIRDKAAVFQLPASSFVAVNLVNKLSNMPCGGNLLQTAASPTGVYCGPANDPGQATTMVAALQTPGAAVIEAGAGLTFKAYDSFYSFYVGSWKQTGDEVSFIEADTITEPQWFSLERLSGPATGGALSNSTQVALKSRATGKYCGISAVAQKAIKCNATGPLSALPDGYRYTFIVRA